MALCSAVSEKVSHTERPSTVPTVEHKVHFLFKIGMIATDSCFVCTGMENQQVEQTLKVIVPQKGSFILRHKHLFTSR